MDSSRSRISIARLSPSKMSVLSKGPNARTEIRTEGPIPTANGRIGSHATIVALGSKETGRAATARKVKAETAFVTLNRVSSPHLSTKSNRASISMR